MRILAIGDPHGNLDNIKKIPFGGISLILLTGDLGKADLARKRAFENAERKQHSLPKIKETSGYRKDVHMEIHNSTIDLLKHLLKYAPVYTIQGNVGIPTDSDVRKYKEKYNLKLPSTKNKIDAMRDVYLIKNRQITLEGLRMGFLEYFMDVSWVKEFEPKDYAKSMKKARKETDKAKRVLKRFNGLDILVCHQPPYGILDKVTAKFAPKHWQGKHAGSKVILDYIRKYQPKYVFCGHIHEGEGMKKIGKTEIYNLGVCGHKIINL